MTKSQPTRTFVIRLFIRQLSFVILMPLVSMKLSILFAMLLTAAVLSAEEEKQKEAPTSSSNEVAVIKTNEGDLVVQFWTDAAPKTVENFKKLARKGFYDGTASHRMIPGFMVQLGDPNTKDSAKEAQYGTGDPGYKIDAEFNDR